MAVTQALPRPPMLTTGRIIGIDIARAMAMLGMVIAHYVWPDDSGSVLDLGASAVSGRAMPLFVMLGGLGVTILTARSAVPDRALLIRAAILFPLGVGLQEATTFIAIILQSYALFFVLAVGLRRLSTGALVGIAAATLVIGGWTYQEIAFDVAVWDRPGQLLDEPGVVLWSLLFNGYYPFFPVGSFFILGMVLGRIDLRAPRTGRALAIMGTTVGIGTVAAAWLLTNALGIDNAGDEEGQSGFAAGRLLDFSGHSEMPAWVISAAGTSVAILGLSLLVAPHLRAASRPVVALGQLALTFYVFQAVLVRFSPHPNTTEIGQEWVTAMVIYFGFMFFAATWRQWFRVGPLELLLRLGSRSRPVNRPVPPPVV